MRRVWRAAALVVIGAVLTLVLGPASRIEVEPVFPVFDKVAHFGAFGLLVWSFRILLQTWPRWLLGGLAIAVGGLTEILQHWTGRDPDPLDFAADVAGVLAALGVWYVWRDFRPRRASARDSSAA